MSTQNFTFMMVAGALTFATASCKPSGIKTQTLSSSASTDAASTQNVTGKIALLNAVTSALTTFDATALTVRNNRPQDWNTTIAQLKTELQQAQTPTDITRVFRRLNATYPSLHAEFTPGEEMQSYFPHVSRALAGFTAEWISQNSTQFRVHRADSSLQSLGENAPKIGDTLLAINGKPMQFWSDENFTFCKYRLRTTCDTQLPANFFNQILSWQEKDGLNFTLSRNGKTWIVAIPFEQQTNNVQQNQNPPTSFACGNEQNRYPDFSIAYTGAHACVYNSNNNPDVAILRITSFDYSDVENNAPIRNPDDEAAALTPWWIANAHWKHLVVDVIDNPGGNSPMSIAALILSRPFQGENIQLQKSNFLDDDSFRKELMWNDNDHIVWFNYVFETGRYGKVKQGEFLAPVAMFCPPGSGCANPFFKPTKHNFSGKVSLLTNSNCLSSCDSFSWALKRSLGQNLTVVGQPSAADSAWARIYIDVFGSIKNNASAGQFDIKYRPVSSAAPTPSTNLLFTQGFILSRPVDPQTGAPINGDSLNVDRFVPSNLENLDTWPADALAAAMH